MVSVNYNEFRKYSDKSLPEAKIFMGKFIKEKLKSVVYSNFIQESSFYDDTMNALDLYIDLPSIIPKVKISHRARQMHGNIFDITIKTKSQNQNISCEFDKLVKLSESNLNPWYYFYCYYDEDVNMITKYIIFDLRKLIKMNEFKDKSIFNYKNDKLNTKDGGSMFNCITINKLIEMEVMCVDWSNGNDLTKYYL